MKKTYIVTGTGKGIGRAFAEIVLANEPNAQVIGISRSNEIAHERFHFLKADLAKAENIEQTIQDIKQQLSKQDFEELVLLNNAGIVAPMNRVGALPKNTTEEAFYVNTIAPLLLMNAILEHYGKQDCKKVIVNISSGAAKVAIDGWAVYSASKAAVDAYTATAAQEADKNYKNTYIAAVSPGVVDTPMQADIRSADEAHFNVGKFKQLKSDGALRPPKEVGEAIYQLTLSPEKWNEVLIRLFDK